MGGDVFFVLVGAILVFAMHGGFAFLEVGTVQHKNQVNALVKILVDFALSTIAYFFIGYSVAYGVNFLVSAATLSGGEGTGFAPQGYDLVKFFFLTTFAAAVPAIISGGIAERMKFLPQCVATVMIVGLFYPFFEGIMWNGNFGFNSWLETTFGAPFNDFAGSIVVHAVGGWMAFAAVMLLGPRYNRYSADGKTRGIPPSSIPWLAMGSWMLCVGWFGFNVMTAVSLEAVSGLVAINSLMAMVGGIVMALIVGKNDPGFVHNGALAGLVAVCAGSNVMHPIGSLVTGGLAGVIFVYGFDWCQNKLKLDDVLGVWPLHGLCGLWGGLAAGIFGVEAMGGMGGVSFMSQLIGSLAGIIYATIAGAIVYGVLRAIMGLRLTDEEQRLGADLTIHKIGANPESDMMR
ncbi:ammonium transporter [Ahrensia sp. R2A130]|uniref:ammonium transporter n=1 Tax=Ahrensia sp. R2A130 TaxID=744979 RepID=UPI0001E0A4F0|nr:ammonium transporter [Ahrensia sp. R2A130]EFL88253.1 putative ammonium transporter [Ahrensia sp. R2A130]